MQLSIITINLNNKSGLEETIRSVISQSYANFEYIVIDGGSSDGSVDVIKKYQNKITQWTSEKDFGIYNAMNKGIEKAKGKYCLFINSDDVLYDNNVVSDFISLNTNSDIVYGNLLFTYPNGKTRKGVMPNKLSFRHMMRDTLWHPVSFIKKELFTIIGKFDEQYSIVSDYDFFIKAVLIYKVSTQKTNRIIAIFKQNGISATFGNKEKILTERSAVQLKYFKKEEVRKGLKTNLIEIILRKTRRRIGV